MTAGNVITAPLEIKLLSLYLRLELVWLSRHYPLPFRLFQATLLPTMLKMVEMHPLATLLQMMKSTKVSSYWRSSSTVRLGPRFKVLEHDRDAQPSTSSVWRDAH
jgi:hypothetical protein